MTRIKICGVTDYDNALMCAQAGADMLGLNFYRQSPRYIERNQARELCDRLRDTLGDSCPLLVGVFVNATVGDVSVITNHVGLDAAQLSGDESDNMVAELHGMAYKAIRPMNKTMALEDIAYYQAHFPKDERLPSILLGCLSSKSLWRHRRIRECRSCSGCQRASATHDAGRWLKSR
jgi:phosphoribosylanthranilate isomerase